MFIKNNNKDTLLLIAGPSGSGKSYITDLLINEFPDKFVKLEQYTTRKKRTKNENTYYFIDIKKYNKIKNNLFAKTCINGDYYGTTTNIVPNKLNIVIANIDGINDIKNWNHKNKDKYNIFILGIDSEDPKIREGRPEEYIKYERNSLVNVVDTWLINKKNKFITTLDVIQELKKYKLL